MTSKFRLISRNINCKGADGMVPLPLFADAQRHRFARLSAIRNPFAETRAA